jgi:hypothetical protein
MAGTTTRSSSFVNSNKSGLAPLNFLEEAGLAKLVEIDAVAGEQTNKLGAVQ